ncbi:hypothetical protein K438DRAFT_645981 [Mycena galopus ATCC 62051]|nr:hypothetical protein K438DRAFT_645981 [Mycena galopus ATCC 62051]
MQRLVPPEMLDPRTARRAPQHHGHPRGGCMGRHAQCRRARLYVHGRDGRGGAEVDGRSSRPPPCRTRPPSRSPRLLPFPTTRAPTANHSPFHRVGSTPDAWPRVSCCVRGARGDGRCGRGCRPRHPTRPQGRRDALAAMAPRCVAVRHLELERILLLQHHVVALHANLAQAVAVRFPI